MYYLSTNLIKFIDLTRLTYFTGLTYSDCTETVYIPDLGITIFSLVCEIIRVFNMKLLSKLLYLTKMTPS